MIKYCSVYQNNILNIIYLQNKYIIWKSGKYIILILFYIYIVNWFIDFKHLCIFHRMYIDKYISETNGREAKGTIIAYIDSLSPSVTFHH
jgi:hypothetical protein